MRFLRGMMARRVCDVILRSAFFAGRRIYAVCREVHRSFASLRMTRWRAGWGCATAPSRLYLLSCVSPGLLPAPSNPPSAGLNCGVPTGLVPLLGTLPRTYVLG